MNRSANRYYKVVAFRFVIAALALLVAARALHELTGHRGSWPLAALLTIGASASLLWPFVVPSGRGGAHSYSPAHGFYLAGMFLVPPAALVVVIAFSIALAGLLSGARAYRTVARLSSTTLIYAGSALFLKLGPAPWDRFMDAASRAGLETIVMAAVLVAYLILQSVALRVEQGPETPHWGAFQPPGLTESFLCLVLAVTMTLLGRVHLFLLVPTLAQVGLMSWMIHRYRVLGKAEAGIGRPDQEPGFGRSAP